ncbi:MAG: uracil-xanthine permease family protein, partial [Firmicutes bacterium]|nr:uracil-xanthine permease family protein [Bacillota bacterium]
MDTSKKKFGRYTGKEIALSFQHMFAMFGATVLVPLITGISPAVALLTAGLGTLAFHLVTKLKVPVFLGSSFAFIPGILAVGAAYGLDYVGGAVIVAGCLNFLFAVLIYFFGSDKIGKLLPPIVTGPVILLIGVSLAFSAVNDMLGKNLIVHATDGTSTSAIEGLSVGGTQLLSVGIALVTLGVTVASMLYGKKFVKIIPILIGLASGYGLCLVLTAAGIKIVDFEAIKNAKWFNVPYQDGFLQLPKFSFGAALIMMPIAIVTFIEHIGDITASSKVCGQNFLKDPGLHRTLLGDGLGMAVAGFFGGPANTTYAENTGVLAATKNYDPRLLRLTAVFAIVIAFLGKFSGVLLTIPEPVKGGIEVIVFGMIAGVGLKVIVESKIDILDSRNITIMGLILIVGVGVTVVSYDPATGSVGGIEVGGDFSLSPLLLATLVGVIANLVFVQKKTKPQDPTSQDQPEGTLHQGDTS